MRMTEQRLPEYISRLSKAAERSLSFCTDLPQKKRNGIISKRNSPKKGSDFSLMTCEATEKVFQKRTAQPLIIRLSANLLQALIGTRWSTIWQRQSISS